MLEENHYMDGRFQSTESQFKPAQKPKPKPEDDESQDSIVYDSQGWIIYLLEQDQIIWNILF